MMAQNTSSAVMAQRVEANDAFDLFPTPLWGARALCNWIEANVGSLDSRRCLEPACGFGHMARALKEYFGEVEATDVQPNLGYAEGSHDFLFPGDNRSTDWIITNPPFNKLREFAEVAVRRSTIGCAMFARTQVLEGGDRYRHLFRETFLAHDRPLKPWRILQFVERIGLYKNRVVDPDVRALDPETGKMTKHQTSASSYCWVLWVHAKPREIPDGVPVVWIPPQRRKLTKPGDYD